MPVLRVERREPARSQAEQAVGRVTEAAFPSVTCARPHAGCQALKAMCSQGIVPCSQSQQNTSDLGRCQTQDQPWTCPAGAPGEVGGDALGWRPACQGRSRAQQASGCCLCGTQPIFPGAPDSQLEMCPWQGCAFSGPGLSGGGARIEAGRIHLPCPRSKPSWGAPAAQGSREGGAGGWEKDLWRGDTGVQPDGPEAAGEAAGLVRSPGQWAQGTLKPTTVHQRK